MFPKAGDASQSLTLDNVLPPSVMLERNTFDHPGLPAMCPLSQISHLSYAHSILPASAIQSKRVEVIKREIKDEILADS